MNASELGSVTWCKSTRSGANGNCVEVAQLPAAIALRDSKNPSGPVLMFSPNEWVAFIEGTKNGEFDRDRPISPVGGTQSSDWHPSGASAS